MNPNKPTNAWKSKPLIELLSLVLDFRGRTPKKLGMAWGGGDIPALSANNVEMGQINFSKECYLGSDALYRKWMTRGDAKHGDIVLTTEAPLGNVAQIPDERRYILSQRTILLRADKSQLGNDYLSQYLRSERFQHLMRQQSSGTTATGIQRAKLELLPLEYPQSTKEQAKIAEILATVDCAIANTEALIAKQQRIKTGLMQDLLTRGIDKRGNLRSEITHSFKDSPLGRIPIEWEVRSLDEISEFVTSGARGWAKYYSAEGALFLRIGNLTREHINMRFDDIVFVQPPVSAEGKRTLVQQGDILISITADLGIIAVIPETFGEGYVNQHIALVRINDNQVEPRFIGWSLQGHAGRTQFERHNESGAKAGLNLPNICSLLVPFPSWHEQKRIADLLDTNTKTIEQLLADKQKQKLLKNGLMQDLLTGKKRVTSLLNSTVTT